MSNHPGSYMLRDVLTLLTQAGVWQHMSRTASQNLVLGIVDLACRRYDCNAGEILDGHEGLGVCYSCRKPVEPLRRGLCLSCWPADDSCPCRSTANPSTRKCSPEVKRKTQGCAQTTQETATAQHFTLVSAVRRPAAYCAV